MQADERSSAPHHHSIKKKIVIGVITAHVFFIFLLTFNSSIAQKRPTIPQKLIVTTIKLKESPPQAHNESKAVNAPPQPIKSDVVHVKKVEKKKAPEKKKNSPTKKAPTTQNIPRKPAIDKKLIGMLKESIAKIDETPHNIPQERITIVPQNIDMLNVDAIAAEDNKSRFSADDKSYQEVLVRKLRTSLILPEYGAVKVSLTIKNDGSVVNVVVIRAENIKNRDYVENALPRFIFPRFGSSFKGHETYSFTVVLNNDF